MEIHLMSSRGDSRGDRLSRLAQELRQMPEKRIQDEIHSVRSSVEVFRGNQRELVSFLAWCEQAPENEDIVYAAAWSKREKQSYELRRLLHNYVAAAMSLVDHTRVSHNRLYEDGDFPDYQPRVERDFARNPLAQFVKGLRMYVTHVQTTGVIFRFNVDDETEEIHRQLGVETATLRDWDGWNAPAKAYLSKASDFIRIADVAAEYGQKVHDFYHWYDDRQNEILGDDLDRYRSKQEEALALKLEIRIDNLLESSDESITGEKVFSGVLDMAEIEQIDGLPQGSIERASRAVELLGHYIQPSEALIAKLRRAFGSHVV
jgi:hypothetical protein